MLATPFLPVLASFLGCSAFVLQIPTEETGCEGAWFHDGDGDGFGDLYEVTPGCRPGADWVLDAEDCDDDDPSVHPDASETCNGRDDDCDGQVDAADPDLDPGSAAAPYLDEDGDGWGGATDASPGCVGDGHAAQGGDCDDQDPSIHPLTREVCGGLDDDCDGQVDDDDPDLDPAGTTPVYADADTDGHPGAEIVGHTCGAAASPDDCDDADAAVHPGATEVCTGGVDEDCDGQVDECQLAYPVGPTEARPAWQGTQEWFLGSDGTECRGRLALAVGYTATCFADADGELYCAGRIGSHTWDAGFEAVGEKDIRQIFLTNYNFDGICVRTDQGIRCMGTANGYGQYGNGTTGNTDVFTDWNGGMDVQGMVTDGWYVLYALDMDGAIWGTNSDGQPSIVDPGPYGFIYYDDMYSRLQGSPTPILRVSDTWVKAMVTADGACGPRSWSCGGTPGHVVSAAMGQWDLSEVWYGWLEDDGTVWFTPDVGGYFLGLPYPFFPGEPVLAMANDTYGQGTCVIRSDGSLWCMGNNRYNRFGPGGDLVVETQILPPGSLETVCER